MTPRDALDHAVYTKNSWLDPEWVLVPYLYAERVTFSVAPAISHAELSYRSGDSILRPDKLEFQPYDRRDLQGKYVRIAINQPPPPGDPDAINSIYWYGIVVDRDEVLLGFDNSAGNPKRDARQTFIAYGLEFLLERKYLTTSIVERDDGSEDTIGRAIGFNLGAGSERDRKHEANGSVEKGSRDAYIFSKSLGENDAIFWNGDDIVEYLVAYHMPQDQNGDNILPWFYDSSSEYLPFVAPTMQVHGRTIREILNMLMDRRRGLTWALNVDDDHNKIEIIPISFATENLDLPSGDGFIPANDNPIPFNVDADRLARDPRLVTSKANVYKRVIVRGERRGAVFTCAYYAHPDIASKDWVPFRTDWKSSLQTEYNSGATDDSHYDDDDDWLRKQAMNQDARKRKKLESVYRFFAICTTDPDTWNGLTAAGNPTTLVDDLDTAKGNEPIWEPGLRLEHHLPLHDGLDYSGDAIAAGNFVNLSPDDKLLDFQRPLGWVKTGTDIETYERLDRLGLGLKEGLILPETLARSYSMSLVMHKDNLGFSIDVHGVAQCAIAKDDFTPADGADGPDTNDPLCAADLNYKDMLVTVYMLSDAYAEGRWPETDDAPDTADVHSTLMIQVQNYFCDYVLKDTVLDTDTAGGLVTVTSSGYVRDDRDKLKDMARMAYEWYSIDRIALEVTLHTLDAGDYNLAIGALITTIGVDSFDTANTVVTEITFDTRAQTRTIKTQFAELDVTALAKGGSL